MIRLSIRITFGWHSLYYAQNSCVNQLKDISPCGCEVYRCRIADLKKRNFTGGLADYLFRRGLVYRKEYARFCEIICKERKS